MVTECVEVYLRWCMIFVKKNGKKWNEQKSWELTVCFRWIVLKVVIFDPFLVIWAKVENNKPPFNRWTLKREEVTWSEIIDDENANRLELKICILQAS